MIKTDILDDFNIDKSYFDFKYFFKFPETDTEKFERGGRDYHRPTGCYRYGLRISGKYDNGDDSWMGDNNSDGEWVNAYHGTKIENVNGILRYGLKPGIHNAYGVGVYCSPKIEIAAGYADPFEYDGEYYQIIIQVRVNPDKIMECMKEDYWYIEESKNIRSFGVLIRKRDDNSPKFTPPQRLLPPTHNRIIITKPQTNSQLNSLSQPLPNPPPYFHPQPNPQPLIHMPKLIISEREKLKKLVYELRQRRMEIEDEFQEMEYELKQRRMEIEDEFQRKKQEMEDELRQRRIKIEDELEEMKMN